MVPGTGVWELTDSKNGSYSYTWYSQIKMADSDQTNLVRVSGTAQMDGCNFKHINRLPASILWIAPIAWGTSRTPIYPPASLYSGQY